MVFGVFKGMGDLLWATPAIRAELERRSEVHLLIFANPLLIELCSLVDLGPNRNCLHFHAVPTGWRDIRRFVKELRSISPAVVLISPHAPIADSSWRVPLALRLIQRLYWPNATLIGAETERLSMLFDRRLKIDRTLPLSSRDWTAYRLFCADTQLPASARPQFLPEITSLRSAKSTYDLLIHPGAGARNRLWSIEKYPTLLASLPTLWRIAFLAFPEEIVALLAVLPQDRHVDFIPIENSLRRSLEALSSARLLLAMNSGLMHFAEVLGIPTVAIFGQQDPTHVIERGVVEPIYEQTAPCQPCGRNMCRQPQVYCLTNLDAEAVARRLKAHLAGLSAAPSAASATIYTQIENS